MFVLTILSRVPSVLYRPARLRGGGGTWVRLGQSSTLSGKVEAVPIKVKYETWRGSRAGLELWYILVFVLPGVGRQAQADRIPAAQQTRN